MGYEEFAAFCCGEDGIACPETCLTRKSSMKKLIVLGFLALFISGCFSNFNPIPEGYTGPRAIIEDSYSNKTGSNAHYFMLTKVNGKDIDDSWGETRVANYGQGTSFKPVIVTRDVPANSQTFTLTGMVFFPTDIQVMFGDDMKIEKQVRFQPETGERYTVKGALSESNSDVWLEDSKGKKLDLQIIAVEK